MGHFNKNNMSGNTNTILKQHDKTMSQKIHMSRDYLINHLYLQRINLKRPLSRASHFKIYFRLECQGNQGSRQNFHGIPLSKDSILIKSDHS